MLKETKSKDSICDYSDGSNVRVSNYIKIIDKEHVVFIFQEDYKSLKKGEMNGG